MSNTVNVSTTTNQVVITPQSTKTVSINSGDGTSLTVNQGSSNTITVSDNVVNTSLTPNTVNITTPPSNGITVTDLRKTITVNQGSTSIVQVASQGPQGPKGDTGATGPQGPSQDTGSLLTTASNAGAGNRVYFTKGDGSQFILTIDNVVNAISASYILADNIDQPFTSIETDQFTASLTENYIWVGNSNNQNTEIPVSSLPGYFPFNYGLFNQTGSSRPITTPFVEESLLDGGVGTLSVPANGFKKGDAFYAVLSGECTFRNNDEINIRVKGGKSGTVILAETGDLTLAGATNRRWKMEINFSIYATGSQGTASIASVGTFMYTKDASSEFVGINFSSINSSSFDTTVPNTLTITGEFNNPGNSIFSKIFTLNKVY